MGKFHPQNCSLQSIQPAVDSLNLVISFSTVPGIQSHPVRQLRVFRHNRPRIAHGSQIFAGIERKCGNPAESSYLPPLVLRQVGLRAVLDDPKSFFLRQGAQLLHRGR